MRVKIGNKVIEFNIAIQAGGNDDHIYLGHKDDREHYVIDCIDSHLAAEFLEQLLVTGYADVGNFRSFKLDYSNDPYWR